jgi:hypothetical protein
MSLKGQGQMCRSLRCPRLQYLQIADDFARLRKSAAWGHFRTHAVRPKTGDLSDPVPTRRQSR